MSGLTHITVGKPALVVSKQDSSQNSKTPTPSSSGSRLPTAPIDKNPNIKNKEVNAVGFGDQSRTAVGQVAGTSDLGSSVFAANLNQMEGKHIRCLFYCLFLF